MLAASNIRIRSPLTLWAAPALAVAMLAAPAVARAQQLPTPFALASQLDLECHAAEGGPPLPDVFIYQLNPVLQGLLPNQFVDVGELEDVCVPVQKNNQTPGTLALNIIKWVDLACYDATALPVDVDVHLSHLNPLLAALPDEDVKLTELKQLCVPVRKNQSQIPNYVRAIISYFDFACYAFEEPTDPADMPLTLSHLNPVIREMNLPNRDIIMKRARQLCVPVAKNDPNIPDFALQFVEWVDFMKYWVTPQTAAAIPAIEAPIPLWLEHLNPLFANIPEFFTILEAPLKLLVPVAKEDVLPPGGPAN